MAKLRKHAYWDGDVCALVNTTREHNFFDPSIQIVGIWPQAEKAHWKLHIILKVFRKKSKLLHLHG